MDWREYIQQREHFSDLPVPVVPLMQARPGATEPGLFPSMQSEHSEAAARVAEHLKRQRRYHLSKRPKQVHVRTVEVEAMTLSEYVDQYHRSK